MVRSMNLSYGFIIETSWFYSNQTAFAQIQEVIERYTQNGSG